MNMLSKHAQIKEDKSNIITLGILAKEAKKKNSKVVNATIGMLYDERGALFSFDSVNKVLAELTDDEKYAYASTPGSKEFHNALKHWVFQEYEQEFLSKMHCAIMATPGGSGAISNTFSNYLNQGDTVLIPNYMWGNYKQFAYENYIEYETYSLFNEEGSFDLEGLKQKMLEVKKRQQRVLLVINDPCQNPTGYTMTYLEWISLISDIKMISRDGTPFILLYDMAYIDYDKRGLTATRENLRLFQNFNENVLTILAFSGSKTLGLYGMRIGAQIALSKSEEVIKEFEAANKFSSRAKWSSSSTMGMNLVTKILSNPKYEETFKIELQQIRDILIKRADCFITEAKKVGLKTLPFDCGFFISIPCKNPMKVYEEIVKEDIHIIPMESVLRVTIAAINTQECKMLPSIIKKHIG